MNYSTSDRGQVDSALVCLVAACPTYVVPHTRPTSHQYVLSIDYCHSYYIAIVSTSSASAYTPCLSIWTIYIINCKCWRTTQQSGLIATIPCMAILTVYNCNVWTCHFVDTIHRTCSSAQIPGPVLRCHISRDQGSKLVSSLWALIYIIIYSWNTGSGCPVTGGIGSVER